MRTLKAGQTTTLKDGTKVKAIPNLIQILQQQNSCKGCYFETDIRCPLICNSYKGRPEDQVIFIPVTEEEPQS